MERVIYHRLMDWLIKYNKLHFYQNAYRSHHNNVDQLFYLCHTIDGLKMKPHRKTVAVFLDFPTAFDRVWSQKLVHICYNTGIKGNALIWINDFLRDRKFSVRFNGVLSELHKLRAGVPQGSVLSPFLFLIYMNTIQPDTKSAYYVDDTAVWLSHIDTAVSKEVINVENPWPT
ncbi:reverse transcriptase domain-containing protein [Nephila pilipes]|uniref:Reverse transcriptase domain-containing protein n=1 Tax=Nephila pilipes TaxID=299642 RepID=A0A8X6TH57_NEPPI|nr:reverse transcriptase domain-containing protein [Nephila pilipes]